MDCTPAPAAASAPSGGGSAAAKREKLETDAQDIAQILLLPDGVTKLIENAFQDKLKRKKHRAAQLAAAADDEESSGFKAVLSMMMGPRAPDAEEIEQSLADVFKDYNEAAGR